MQESGETGQQGKAEKQRSREKQKSREAGNRKSRKNITGERAHKNTHPLVVGVFRVGLKFSVVG